LDKLQIKKLEPEIFVDFRFFFIFSLKKAYNKLSEAKKRICFFKKIYFKRLLLQFHWSVIFYYLFLPNYFLS